MMRSGRRAVDCSTITATSRLTKFSDFPLPLTISVVFEMSSEEHVCDLDSASQPKVKYLSDVWIHI